MSALKAVIDLGSNTFHLLIARMGDHGSFDVLEKKRIFVFLLEGGQSHIEEEALIRAKKALETFALLIDSYADGAGIDIIPLGTSACRSASNLIRLEEMVSSMLGEKLKIITGEDEARIIARGLEPLLAGHQAKTTVAMDIGGGSVELMIFVADKLNWSESFDLGIARLYNEFHNADPIAPTQIERMRQHIVRQFSQVPKSYRKLSDCRFIGLAGSFEVLSPTDKARALSAFDPGLVNRYFDRFKVFNAEERTQSSLIPKERSKYIIEAMVLIQEVFGLFDFSEHFTSPFSLKEGALLYF